MWLTFAPIPNYTASYYNVPVSSVDWFSMVFFAVSLVVGFFSIFVLSRWGLKVTVSEVGGAELVGLRLTFSAVRRFMQVLFLMLWVPYCVCSVRWIPSSVRLSWRAPGTWWPCWGRSSRPAPSPSSSMPPPPWPLSGLVPRREQSPLDSAPWVSAHQPAHC